MKLVVGNFKMNLLQNDISEYVKLFKDFNTNNIVFCPPNIYLRQFHDNGYLTGSQNIGFSDCGAYTGDVSIKQLVELGIKYVIIGHSERRKYYNDSQYVSKKVQLSLSNNIVPILCIGESKDERENNLTYEILKKELDEALEKISIDLIRNVVIAYEPIWSIGTNIIPSNREIYETINYIKNYIKNKYRVDLKVLYGGSVNIANIKLLETINNIDGYLVGGCSIDVIKFIELIKCIN